MSGLLARLVERSQAMEPATLRPVVTRPSAEETPLVLDRAPLRPEVDAVRAPNARTIAPREESDRPLDPTRPPIASKRLLPPIDRATVADSRGRQRPAPRHVVQPPLDDRRIRPAEPVVDAPSQSHRPMETASQGLNADVPPASSRVVSQQAETSPRRFAAVQPPDRRLAPGKESASPEVHIHIGRIDVRAPMLPQAEKRPTAKRPAASLDDYLATRRGRR